MDKSCTVSGKLSAAELNQSLFLERGLDSEKQLKKCSDYVKDFPRGLVASELTGKMGVFSAAINFQMHDESRTLSAMRIRCKLIKNMKSEHGKVNQV